MPSNTHGEPYELSSKLPLVMRLVTVAHGFSVVVVEVVVVVVLSVVVVVVLSVVKVESSEGVIEGVV